MSPPLDPPMLFQSGLSLTPLRKCDFKSNSSCFAIGTFVNHLIFFQIYIYYKELDLTMYCKFRNFPGIFFFRESH